MFLRGQPHSARAHSVLGPPLDSDGREPNALSKRRSVVEEVAPRRPRLAGLCRHRLRTRGLFGGCRRARRAHHDGAAAAQTGGGPSGAAAARTAPGNQIATDTDSRWRFHQQGSAFFSGGPLGAVSGPSSSGGALQAMRPKVACRITNCVWFSLLLDALLEAHDGPCLRPSWRLMGRLGPSWHSSSWRPSP
eukprot:1633509-Pyramimonas_sp.AAC.1